MDDIDELELSGWGTPQASKKRPATAMRLSQPESASLLESPLLLSRGLQRSQQPTDIGPASSDVEALCIDTCSQQAAPDRPGPFPHHKRISPADEQTDSQTVKRPFLSKPPQQLSTQAHRSLPVARQELAQPAPACIIQDRIQKPSLLPALQPQVLGLLQRPSPTRRYLRHAVLGG